MELKWHEHLKPFSDLYDTAAEILVGYLQILGCSAIELDQILLFTLPYPGSVHALQLQLCGNRFRSVKCRITSEFTLQ